MRRSVTRVFFDEYQVVLLHPKGEVFIRAHGPGFGELLRSSNHPTMTREPVDYLLLRESWS